MFSSRVHMCGICVHGFRKRLLTSTHDIWHTSSSKSSTFKAFKTWSGGSQAQATKAKQQGGINTTSMDLWIPCGFPLASSEACSPALASLDRDQSKARRENKEINTNENERKQKAEISRISRISISQCNNWNFEHHAFLGPISSTPVSKTRKVSSLNCFKL